jgi:hypothetical protein
MLLGTMTEAQVHARHSYMVAVVEMPTDLSQKNNVRGTAEVSKARVGIVVEYIYILSLGFYFYLTALLSVLRLYSIDNSVINTSMTQDI